MKLILKPVVVAATLCLFATVLSCTSNETAYRSCEGKTQGTMYHVVYEYHEDLCPQIDSLLKQFSLSLSNYNRTSVVSKFNYNSPDFKPDSLLIRMIHDASEVYNNTHGMFDITIAPVANCWGFGWEKKAQPDTANLSEAMQWVGMDKIILNGNSITKAEPQVQIITNGIAQGLSVDWLAEYFQSKGINNYLIEIGGEVLAAGTKRQKELWRIGIDKPIVNSGYNNRDTQIIIEISGKAVATSGNYRKFVEMDGVTMGHSINPKTGYPATTDLLSATVLTNRCVMADAYATAFMVMGLQASLQLAERLPDIEAYFIYIDENGEHQSAQTSKFANFIAP